MDRSWDNRSKPVRIDPKTGRSWTRRIRWLSCADQIKLKLEVVIPDKPAQYKEVLCDEVAAKTIWDRFKNGQSIDDSVSILGNVVPKGLQSKRASEEN